jgi:hypothetical protein
MRTTVARVLAAPVAVLGVLALGIGPAAAIPRPAAASPSATPTRPPSVTPRPGPSLRCAAGLSALEAGRLVQAETIYGSVVPRNSACARSGQSAALDLLEARAMIQAGYTSSASQYLEQAVQAEPAMSIPGDALPMTVGLQGREVAETLETDGLPVQARQVLVQVLENNPHTALDQEDRVILGEVSPPLGTQVKHVITNPFVLTGLVLALLFAFSLRARWRRRLHFQPFDAGDDADAGPGPTAILRSLIRKELHRLAEESARLRDGGQLRIDQAGPYEDQFDLGPVLDSLPSVWKPLALAADALLKGMGARSRLVCGMLLPTAAVILEMRTVQGVVKNMCTIKHKELGFPPPDQDILPQLALPAAVWIALTHYPDATLGGTRDWRSYVDFAAGCAWEDKGDMDRARECYTRACNYPDNLAARLNLAALELREECAVPQDDPSGLPSYQRLSSLLKDTAGRTGDLQWYRTRYLLSSGLRDIVDFGPDRAGNMSAAQNGHAPASANGHAPDPAKPRPGETLIDVARRNAAELALELERRIAERRGLPKSFVEYGRAAALTLVARQVDLKTPVLEDVMVERKDTPEYTDDGAVMRALRNVLDSAADVGTAERLVDFVRSYCPVDEQAQYNLYRYHQTRAKNLAAAIENWNIRLRKLRQDYGEHPPQRVWDWARDISEKQDRLGQLYDKELSQMRACAQQVEEAGDPVLIERLNAARRLDPEGAEPRYRGGHRRERPAERESRPPWQAPDESPDTSYAALVPSAPDLPALAPESPEAGPTRPDLGLFDLVRDIGSGRDDAELPPDARPDPPDPEHAGFPGIPFAAGGFGTGAGSEDDYDPDDDHPDEPGT